MKYIRTALALMIVAAFAGTATAQTNIRHGHNYMTGAPANRQALAALQQDLINAIETMKSALPIYDGNRARSIHQAHEALVIVDRAIAGANAVVRPKPTATDNIASKTAHTKYTQQQIVASQATMRKGYAVLQQAYKDLQVAAGANPNQKAVNVNTHLQTAGSEATKAIALHAAQG